MSIHPVLECPALGLHFSPLVIADGVIYCQLTAQRPCADVRTDLRQLAPSYAACLVLVGRAGLSGSRRTGGRTTKVEKKDNDTVITVDSPRLDCTALHCTGTSANHLSQSHPVYALLSQMTILAKANKAGRHQNSLAEHPRKTQDIHIHLHPHATNASERAPHTRITAICWQ